ncbi:MAG: succinate dehydrogenase cytochrome b558 subunit [Armatimonadaceae bacterium]
MGTTVIRKGQPGSKSWFKDSFVLHKLHSLTGVLPIGAFLIFHLVVNSYTLRGEKEFNTAAAAIGYLPFVQVVEWALIFIPILFHSIYGFMITAEMRNNTGTYQYGRNWLYLLQRISGVIAFVFIVYHVYDTWFIKKLYENSGGHELGLSAISYAAMTWRFADPIYLLVYLVGVGMAVFHLGNGLFNFCIRWGITVGKTAQNISAFLWLGLSIVLTLIGFATAINLHLQARDFRGAGAIRQQYPTLDDVVKAGAAESAEAHAAAPTAVTE